MHCATAACAAPRDLALPLLEPRTGAPALRFATVLSLSALLAAGLFAAAFSADRIVSAPGVLRPEGELLTVRSGVEAAVARIRVREGAVVAAGDALVEFDAADARRRAADLDAEIRAHAGIVEQLDDLERELARRAGAIGEGDAGAIRAAQQAEARERARLAEARRVGAAEIESAELERRTAAERLQALVQLSAARCVSEQELAAARGAAARSVAAAERARLAAAGDSAPLDAAVDRVAQARRECAAHALDLAARGREAALRRSEETLALGRLRTERARAEREIEAAVVVAPAAGIVIRLAVHHAGEFVPAHAALLQLAPAGAEEVVVATIRNEDVARVEAGMRARLQFDAFPRREFGTISGRVRALAPDTAEDAGGGGGGEYRASVVLDPGPLRSRLRLGLRARVEIETGRRSLLELLWGGI